MWSSDPTGRFCYTQRVGAIAGSAGLRGLQFRTRLGSGEALILAKKTDSIASSSIHMLFVFFPIAAVWVNTQGKVTHAQLAKPWRLYYASPEPASYVIETTPEFLNKVAIGDEVDFIPAQ